MTTPGQRSALYLRAQRAIHYAQHIVATSAELHRSQHQRQLAPATPATNFETAPATAAPEPPRQPRPRPPL